MSIRGKQNKVLAALAGFGVLVAANYYFRPPVTRAISAQMNRELDQYNATPHPEQDPNDTILDRTKLMEAAKERKPWNKTFSDRSKMR